MKFKSTLLAAAFSLTSLSTLANDATIPVEASFTTVCSIVDVPTSLDFTDSLIGEIRTIDFTVSVDCNFANESAEVTIDLPSIVTAGASIVFTQQGAALESANVIAGSPVSYSAPGAGEQTVIAQFTAHLVDSDRTLAPPRADVSISSLAEVFLAIPNSI